jgi:hypothetical protein
MNVKLAVLVVLSIKHFDNELIKMLSIAIEAAPVRGQRSQSAATGRFVADVAGCSPRYDQDQKEKAMPDATVPAAVAFRSDASAPVVYFDSAPAFGVMGGVIEIELTARTLVPNFSGGPVSIEILPAARLRCSPGSAEQLVEALNKALELLKQLQSTGTAAAAVGDKLN